MADPMVVMMVFWRVEMKADKKDGKLAECLAALKVALTVVKMVWTMVLN